jgi:hypothetical protein
MIDDFSGKTPMRPDERCRPPSGRTTHWANKTAGGGSPQGGASSMQCDPARVTPAHGLADPSRSPGCTDTRLADIYTFSRPTYRLTYRSAIEMPATHSLHLTQAYAYKYAHTHTHIMTHAYIHMHVQMHTIMGMRMRIYIHTHLHIHIHIHDNARTRIRIHIRIHIRIRTYTYTYFYTYNTYTYTCACFTEEAGKRFQSVILPVLHMMSFKLT